MGLLDWLFRRKRDEVPTVSRQFHVDIKPTAGRSGSTISLDIDRVPAADNARWVPPGQSVTVHYSLPGGMVYVGSKLRAHSGHPVDPCLIDPSLPVRTGRREPLGYWPSYSELSPANREAYLAWLSAGRYTEVEEIGFVFLFFYGLERRVLVDLMPEPRTAPVRAELARIRDEVHRLLQIYGPSSGSFRGYASRFRETIDILLHDGSELSSFELPPLTQERWDPPITLRMVIGMLARDEKPVPADWALAWAWYFPETRLRTPATRCTDELQRLFRVRYQERFRGGLRPKPGKSLIRVSYRAASSGIGNIPIDTGSIPNTFELKSPARKFIALLDEVQAELDPYSRWRGRNPDASATLEQFALLPIPLVTEELFPIARLKGWLDSVISHPDGTVIPGRDLLAQWASPPPQKMTKATCGSLATVLEKVGVGVEPDARLGGSTISAEQPVVLYRLGDGPVAGISDAYANAMTLVHMMTAVSAADGHVSVEELNALGRHAEERLELSRSERRRLHAHVLWLASIEIRLTGLKKRLEPLTLDQKQAIADIIVSVASADGVVSPGEVATIRRVYSLLGLDAERVTSHLHGALTTSPTSSPTGHRVTPPRQAEKVSSGAGLDPEVIARKQQETAAVSVLLNSIFSDDDDEEEAAIIPEEPCDEDDVTNHTVMIEGLDPDHSRLVAALVGRDRWSQQEFDSLAESHHLMPAGAMDVINEYALDQWGEPLIEEDDDLVINDYVRKDIPV